MTTISSPAIVAVDRAGCQRGPFPRSHPLRTVCHRRSSYLVLLASGVAISAWALFPSTVERGIYVPLPETSTPSAADVNSAREGVGGNPLELSRANAFKLMDAKLVSSKPTMYGPVTARYSSPVVNVSVVPLRSKLQALLMLLYSQSGDVDPAALEAKLQALLTVAGFRIGTVDGTP